MAKPLEIIVLAAGQGTRMRSALPKVLHPLGGRPLLQHVVDTAQELMPRAIHVVFGHGGAQVCESLGAAPINWVEQTERLGTGHAVAQALPHIGAGSDVLVLYGDVPLVPVVALIELAAVAAQDRLGLLTVTLDDATGYGRIVRGAAGAVVAIVEQKDANAQQLGIKEVNTGIMAIPGGRLPDWIGGLGNGNAQGEYYLTDVVASAVRDGVGVDAIGAGHPDDVLGVNDRAQLAHLERAFQRRQADRLLLAGVTLHDPSRFDLRGKLEVGRDVTIDVNVVIEGNVTLGDGVSVGANCILKDVQIAAGTRVLPMSLIEGASIGSDCHVGPFARIRPGTQLAEGARIGNFVEVKNSLLGEGSKVNHLAYVGDTTMGRKVNIGAGTITCNYDGANKHRTFIGDDVFVGSDSQLVAPITIGDGATIGAGSTITRDAPAGELTLSRNVQKSIPGWRRPVKAPK